MRAPVLRAVRRAARERRLPPHVRDYLAWQLFRHKPTNAGLRPEPAASPVKASLCDAAAQVLVALDKVGAFAFLIDDSGYRIHIGLADEHRKLAVTVLDDVVPDWTVQRSNAEMIATPHWSGTGGACIELSFWQANDLGERERVGVRGLSRLFAGDNLQSAELAGRRVPAAPTFVSEERRHRPRFPIDAVITWVDEGDTSWRRNKQEAIRAVSPNPSSVSADRFRSRDELRFLLRSLDAFAPFFRRIFIVTDCRSPEWLNLDPPEIEIVHQTSLLGGEPVFNSLAVESALHHIPGLGEHYVYFNDDMFIARPIEPELFFSPAGLMRVSRGPLIRSGPPDATLNAFESSAQQARDLVADVLGWVPVNSAPHVPLPQRKSVALQMEQRFAAAISRTRQSTFRSVSDTASATGLLHYLGAELGMATESDMATTYINTSSTFARAQYAALLRSPDVDTFCCNDDAVGAPARQKSAETHLRSFLEHYFPTPSRFENP